MLISCTRRQFTVFICEWKMSRSEYFRCDKIRSTHDIGWIFTRHNKTIAVYDTSVASGWVKQYIIVRKVTVGKTSCMKASYGTRNLDKHVKMGQPGALVFRTQETVTQFGRSKPFTILLFTSKITVCKKELFLISRYYQANTSFPFYKTCRPCEQILPVVTPRLIEYSFTIKTYNIIKSVASISIEFIAKE